MSSVLNVHLTSAWSGVDQAGTSIRWRGSAFKGDAAFDFGEMLSSVEPLGFSEAVSASLGELSGFFSYVVSTGDQLIAAVDPVRTIPLFYAIKDESIYVSDSAEWLRLKTAASEMDPIARDEFLLAGYVTGSETLYAEVKQLQAGEILTASRKGQILELDFVRYFSLKHTEPEAWSLEDLDRALSEALVSCFRRLVAYAAGRQIVLPLSGGYDSRLVALALKKLNYENVLCFCYGRAGNDEAIVSKEVARALGFSWLFVEYTDDDWRDEWSTPLGQAYRLEASGHSSLPHPQDWLACRILMRDELCDADAVIVPGHTGDFISGGHIPSEAFVENPRKLPSIPATIAEHHYNNGPWSAAAHLRASMLDRIASRLNGPPHARGGVEFADTYETWEWQERQAKYICNSVRVYDFFSLDWWLPLWDLEFIRFWQTCPLTLRQNRNYYINFVDASFQQVSGNTDDSFPVAAAAQNTPPRLLARRVLRWFPWPLQQRLRGAWLARSIEKGHFLSFGGLIPVGVAPRMAWKGWNLIGMLAKLHLEGVWDTREEPPWSGSRGRRR